MAKRYGTYSTRVKYGHTGGPDDGPRYTHDSDVKLVTAAKSRTKDGGPFEKGAARGPAAMRSRQAAAQGAAVLAEAGMDGSDGDAASADSPLGSAQTSGSSAARMARRLRAGARGGARAAAGRGAEARAPEAAGGIAGGGPGFAPPVPEGAVSAALARASEAPKAAAGAWAGEAGSGTGGAVSAAIAKRARSAAAPAGTDARMQAARNFAASRASVASAREGAAVAAAPKAGAPALAPASAGAAGAGGAATAAAAAAAALVLAAVVGICALVMLSGGGREDVGPLTGNEAVIARYLLGKDMDALHVAAVMGNISQESGFDPSAIESNGEGVGICQWSFGRKADYYAYADASGRSWDDLACQLDWLWLEYTGGRFTAAQRSSFEAMGDLDQATMYFGRVFEAPSEQYANWEKRTSEAARIYAALLHGGSGGFGEEYGSASARQRAVADSARTTPWAGDGWCAAYVSRVFERAGESAPYGNACDMARAPWCSSTDRSELKVGMVIAVESSPYGSGVVYGHVGVYVGDNLVMHNVSSGVETTDLDRWIDEYSRLSPARWGWANGVDLS